MTLYRTRYPFAPGVLQRGPKRARRAQRKVLWGALALLGMALAAASVALMLAAAALALIQGAAL